MVWSIYSIQDIENANNANMEVMVEQLKGNRKAAFLVLLVSILLGLALIKPIFIGVIWLIGWVLQGIVAFIFVGLFIIGGYWLYRIEDWAFKTLFTNKEPDFPDMTIDGMSRKSRKSSDYEAELSDLSDQDD
jgi:4-hydroxybenzoate polyprenyltransferase